MTDTSFRIIDLVGNTPLIEIPNSADNNVRIFAKCEWANPSGSVKDRAANAIIKSALKNRDLSNKILIDATSGNTGIAFAMLAAYYRVPVELAMPESASIERRLLIKNYGAKLHLTPASEGPDGAQRFVQERVLEQPERYYHPDQYNNDNNWQAHFNTTGPEIWKQSDQSVSHFVSGMGTSGTFIGTSRYLKQHGVKCFSVQPDAPDHGIEGWRHMESAIVPGIYDPTVADYTLTVNRDQANSYACAAFRHLALPLSPSAAANLYAAKKLADSLESATVVTVFPDNANKYLQDKFWSDHDNYIENPFY